MNKEGRNEHQLDTYLMRHIIGTRDQLFRNLVSQIMQKNPVLIYLSAMQNLKRTSPPVCVKVVCCAEGCSQSNLCFYSLRIPLFSGVYYSFQREVSSATMLVMRNLHHYARYTIKVVACREIDPMEDPTKPKNCSREAIINQRTLPKGD